jgi:hypothetical protein
MRGNANRKQHKKSEEQTNLLSQFIYLSNIDRCNSKGEAMCKSGENKIPLSLFT